MLGVSVVTTSITPSGSFSVETLTGLTPSWKTELNRSISIIKDRIVKIVDNGLYFISSFHFILLFFSFSFFIFLFLEQLGLGFISQAVTSVTKWWHSHKTDHGTWEKEVKGSGTKWRHTVWTTHAGLMSYSWSFRVGCTVASNGPWVIVYKVDYFVLGTLSSSLVSLQYKGCFLT